MGQADLFGLICEILDVQSEMEATMLRLVELKKQQDQLEKFDTVNNFFCFLLI